MLVEVSTGFSAGFRELPDVPREGEILHQAEFIYRVAGVVWMAASEHPVGQYPCVYVLPIKKVPGALGIARNFEFTSRVPRVGEFIERNGDEGELVTMVEWLVNQYPQYGVRPGPASTYIRMHLLTQRIQNHIGIKAVIDGANEYGKHWADSSLSAMQSS